MDLAIVRQKSLLTAVTCTSRRLRIRAICISYGTASALLL